MSGGSAPAGSAGGRYGLAVSGAVSAAPDVVLGLTYAALFAGRLRLDGPLVQHMAWAIMIEFPAVHASGFLVMPWLARWQIRSRALFVTGLVAAYTVALLVVALLVHGWWPVTIFWGLMLNRMLTVILGDLPDEAALRTWTTAWMGVTTLYVFAAMIGLLAFGGSASTRCALLIGALYFTAVGLSGLSGWGWLDRWRASDASRAARPAGIRRAS